MRKKIGTLDQCLYFDNIAKFGSIVSSILNEKVTKPRNCLLYQLDKVSH